MVSWDDFFERIAQLRTQFRLAETAIQGWGQSQEMLEKFAQNSLVELRDMIRERTESNDSGKGWIFTDEARINDYLQSVQVATSQKITEVKERLRQYEYILLVTLFENFLKTVHRKILETNRELLKPDRKIELGRLVIEGEEDILAKEVEREVRSLDRETIQKRADYFRHRLKIDWTFSGRIIPTAESVITLRNTILHEDPDRKVRGIDLEIATLVCTGVTFAAAAGAAVLYPDACFLPHHLQEEKARKFYTV